MNTPIVDQEIVATSGPSTIEPETNSTASAILRGTSTRRQIRGSSLLLFGGVLAKGINFFVQVLIVRYLTKNDYGAFAYALSIATFAAIICAFGLNTAVARFAPIYHEKKEYAKMAGTVMMTVGTVVTLGAGMVLLVYALRGVIQRTLISDPATLSVLMIMIFLAPLQALDTLMNSMFAVFSRPKAIFFRKYLLGPFLKLSVVILLMVLQSDVLFLAMGYLFASVLAIAVYTVILIQMLKDLNLLSYFHPRVIQIPAREILAFSLPLLTSDLIFTLMNTLDVVLLEFFHNSADVATLRAVQPTAKLNQLVLDNFSLMFAPIVARLFARKDHKGISKLYWQNAVWVSVITFPIFALTFSLAKPITLLLYGQRYAQSALILALLSFGYYFNAATGQNGLTLQVFGKLRLIVLINLAGTALNVAANLFLIPRYGAIGAAWGTFTTMVVFNLLKQLALSRQTGVSFFENHYMRVYVVIALSALSLLVIQMLFSPPVYISVLLAGIASWLVLRANHQLLNVEQTFPELLKIPLAKRLLL